MSSATIESREKRIARANEVMGAVLDQKTDPLKRHPLRLEDYKWEQARPDEISPTLKRALEFVSHVEFPPHLYAEPLLAAADNEGAAWLMRFIENTWLPEETQHGVLLRQAAIVYGAVSQEEHDKNLAAINALDFPIGRGYTTGKASTYGRTQELITQLFYVSMMHSCKDPLLKRILSDLAKQEMFHSMFYRGGMDFATPDEITQAILEFRMPGHVTSPALQQQSAGWAEEFGFNFRRMKHTLATDLLDLTGYEGLGQVVTSPLIRGTYPPPIRVLLTLADRIRNPGLNRLIGQYAANQVLPKSKTA